MLDIAQIGLDINHRHACRSHRLWEMDAAVNQIIIAKLLYDGCADNIRNLRNVENYSNSEIHIGIHKLIHGVKKRVGQWCHAPTPVKPNGLGQANNTFSVAYR